MVGRLATAGCIADNDAQRSVKDPSKVKKLQKRLSRTNVGTERPCSSGFPPVLASGGQSDPGPREAGGYENSNEIGVSNVGGHWLVSYTSLTRGKLGQVLNADTAASLETPGLVHFSSAVATLARPRSPAFSAPRSPDSHGESGDVSSPAL